MEVEVESDGELDRRGRRSRANGGVAHEGEGGAAATSSDREDGEEEGEEEGKDEE
jgi:hypothetical protein